MRRATGLGHQATAARERVWQSEFEGRSKRYRAKGRMYRQYAPTQRDDRHGLQELRSICRIAFACAKVCPIESTKGRGVTGTMAKQVQSLCSVAVDGIRSRA